MSKLIEEVREYYTAKIKQFGATPQGVDWNSKESQELRFDVLSTLIDEPVFSVLDFGCGFGSMFEYYSKKYENFNYTGFDIAEEMIQEAVITFTESKNAVWTASLPNKKYDYVIASGIFNVKLENTDENWLSYILETIQTLNEVSEKGFAFNILTSYSDKEYMKDYLFYGDPLLLFDYSKKHFSKNVALLHDYNLYEFTILVRK
ncbi:methyltransferase family protein [Flavobacterium sp. 270]|uniref:class I SAM-dependent methyltransferase n=1 Tax=Flavobacterium sp. 270 TaxID=2512114 RepID=UPI001066216F|nr:class I SAM-dependent methyltransferase [Flavobacterium sp. 270]TDW47139.1 methyltransferase family protein [Flavobacterium sp. 270]